jgi:hypothetical protein
MGNQILCRTIGQYILEDIDLGFSFYLWDSLTRELLYGLLGWREKRGFLNPLSESPLDNHWSPGVVRIMTNCGAELSTDDPVIPNFHREQGDRVIQLKGKTKG